MDKSLASRLLSMIESSICVPNVLGSNATVTPVPNIPVEEVPTQEFKNIKKIKIRNSLFFIFDFKTIIINF